MAEVAEFGESAEFEAILARFLEVYSSFMSRFTCQTMALRLRDPHRTEKPLVQLRDNSML